jgi:hypothetical protein
MNYEELPKRKNKQKTLKNSKVSQQEQEYRVEYWTDQDVRELVFDLDIKSKFERKQYE